MNVFETKQDGRVKELEAALKTFADMFDGELENTGGGTKITQSMTMQPFKIAKQLLRQGKKMEAWQKRVIDEKTELDEKRQGRERFIRTAIFHELHDEEHLDKKNQFIAM